MEYNGIHSLELIIKLVDHRIYWPVRRKKCILSKKGLKKLMQPNKLAVMVVNDITVF